MRERDCANIADVVVFQVQIQQGVVYTAVVRIQIGYSVGSDLR